MSETWTEVAMFFGFLAFLGFLTWAKAGFPWPKKEATDDQ